MLTSKNSVGWVGFGLDWNGPTKTAIFCWQNAPEFQAKLYLSTLATMIHSLHTARCSWETSVHHSPSKHQLPRFVEAFVGATWYQPKTLGKVGFAFFSPYWVPVFLHVEKWGLSLMWIRKWQIFRNVCIYIYMSIYQSYTASTICILP